MGKNFLTLVTINQSYYVPYNHHLPYPNPRVPIHYY